MTTALADDPLMAALDALQPAPKLATTGKAAMTLEQEQKEQQEQQEKEQQ